MAIVITSFKYCSKFPSYHLANVQQEVIKCSGNFSRFTQSLSWASHRADFLLIVNSNVADETKLSQVDGEGLKSKKHPSIRLVKLKKTVENLSQDGQPWGLRRDCFFFSFKLF